MESTTITVAPGRAIAASPLTEALWRTAAAHPEIVAVRTPDDSVSLTWSELLERVQADRKSTRLNSSHRCISYAVFRLKKNNRCRTRIERGQSCCFRWIALRLLTIR